MTGFTLHLPRMARRHRRSEADRTDPEGGDRVYRFLPKYNTKGQRRNMQVGRVNER